MAAPVFRSHGGAWVDTGDLYVHWPSDAQVGDVGFLIVASDAPVATPTGFTPIATGNDASGTTLSVFFKRVAALPEAAAGIPDVGVMQGGMIVAFSGVVPTGVPAVCVTASKPTPSTTVTFPSVSTLSADPTLLLICAKSTGFPNISGYASASGAVSSISERADTGFSSGSGHAYAVATAAFAGQGPSGAVTASNSNSQADVTMTLAVLSAPELQPACIDDPYFSCDPLALPRTVLRLHADDQPTDPLHAATQLLLHFNAGSLADSSAAARTVVLTGSGQVSTTRALFGTHAYENTSTTDTNAGLETGANFSLATGTESLFIELAVYRTSSGTQQSCFSIPGALDIYLTASGELGTFSAGIARNSSIIAPLNTWTRIAVLFRGWNGVNHGYRLYRDGQVLIGGGGGSFIVDFSGAKLAVGKGLYAAFVGSVDEVRVTKADRWSDGGDYTVPPMAFPDGVFPTASDCSCARPKTVTYRGIATPSAAALVFGARSFYIPASANTSSNGLVVAGDNDFSFGSRDFAIRFWVLRYNAISSHGMLFRGTLDNGLVFTLRANPDNGRLTVTYGSSSGQQQGAQPALLPTGVWRQVILQRRANQWETYLHGVLIDQRAVAGGSASTVNLVGDLYFGCDPAPSLEALNGYMDEIDILHGAALATGDFTPPAAPMCCAELQTFWPAGCFAWPAGAVAI